MFNRNNMRLPLVSKSPIRKNLLANSFGIVVQLLNQIVLVPFYIIFWGNELYSDWIVLSALTTIFSISDIGLNNVIQNRFSIKLAEGKNKECDALLTNNFILIGGTLFVTLMLIMIFISTFNITDVMNIHAISKKDASIVFIILTCKVFIGMFSGVENAIYRATHNAGRSIYLDQIVNLTIGIITLSCIALRVHVVLLALLICIPQTVMIIYKHYDARKYYHYYLNIKSFDWILLKRLLVPSLSFMSFPISNSIILQGYTLIVNSFFGAESVVLFNTTRTLCNFLKAMLGTLQNSVWPEYSIAYGKKDFALMQHLHRKILKVTIYSAGIMSLGLLLFGPFIYQLWTHGRVEFSYALMATYIGVLFVESIWTSSSVTLMSTNNHTKLGIINLISSLTCLLTAILLGYHNVNLWCICLTQVLMHIIISIYTLPAGFRLTKDKISK